MLNDETLKALIEGIIYVAPEPVTFDAIAKTLPEEDRERLQARLQELIADYQRPEHGMQIRQVAGGFQFATKPEHHEVLRTFVKSLKPRVKLSKQALETLAVIAYRQPVTVPEIDEVRGVDSGGVIHTLMEKKLVTTSGRKNVVGRPILYRTTREFLVNFGLKDVGELPSLKEFEEMARQALGAELEPESASAEKAPAPPHAEGTAAEAANPEGSDAQPVLEMPPTESTEEKAEVAEEPTEFVANTEGERAAMAEENPAEESAESADESPIEASPGIVENAVDSPQSPGEANAQDGQATGDGTGPATPPTEAEKDEDSPHE